MKPRSSSASAEVLEHPPAEKPDRPKPRHREVFDTLLGEISSGRLRPGDRLPTEAELARKFSASRTTIARAMRDLKGQGLLNRQRGGGTHLSQRECRHIALFAPFALNASSLGFVGGQIHAHLSDLASRKSDHLRLQLVNRAEGNLLDQMLAAAESLIQQSVDGVFYYPIELAAEESHFNKMVTDKLRSAGVPVVAVDRDIVSFPQRSELPLVTFDNRRAGYLIAEHLIERGCKKIAFIGTRYVSSAASDRRRGFCDALEDFGLHDSRSLIREVTPDELDTKFCRRLLTELKADAIICKDDLHAAVTGRCLVEMGLKIGRDVMLAGFDDAPIAELLPVPLTTIRFPIEPLAQVCYERLTSLMANPGIQSPGQTLIDVELMVRSSTGLSV
jgi:GntR family transcriptional regulator of arabinose operon